MAGRRPKPTRLHVLKGNRGKRPLPKGEPQPRPVMPDPPAYLGPIALAKWKSLAPELHRLGLLTLVDDTLLGMYCQTYQRWEQANEALEREGLTTVTAAGRPLKSPYFEMARDAVNLLYKIAGEYGLTPAARVRVATGAPLVDDPLEQFLAQRKKGKP
jgi:P27 family predicted phage terminase small subunit